MQARRAGIIALAKGSNHMDNRSELEPQEQQGAEGRKLLELAED